MANFNVLVSTYGFVQFLKVLVSVLGACALALAPAKSLKVVVTAEPVHGVADDVYERRLVKVVSCKVHPVQCGEINRDKKA